MFRVFNMGIGMVLVCDPNKVSTIQTILPEAITIGEVIEGTEVILSR